MKYQEGFRFIRYREEVEIITFIERHNMYLLNNFTENRQDELILESEIDRHMGKQDYYKEKIESNRLFLLKQEELERIEQEKERQKQFEYDNTYGFTDKLTPMQKGKILKTLNILMNYESYGCMKRKDFILKALKDGAIPEIKHNLSHWGKNGIKKIEQEYTIDFKSHWVTVTKIEYDYAMYLYNIELNVAM